MSKILFSKSKFLKDDLRYILFSELALGPTTPPGKKKAHGVLESAITYIAENGALASSLSDIARKANVPRGTVGHYFSNLENLHISAFKFIRYLYQSYVLEAIGSEQQPQIIFERYFEAALNFPKTFPRHAQAWISFLHFTKIHPAFLEINTEAVRIGYERLLALISRGIITGVFAPREPEKAARAIHIIITGLLWSEATEDNPHVQRQRAAMYEACLAILNSTCGQVK